MSVAKSHFCGTKPYNISIRQSIDILAIGGGRGGACSPSK